MKTTIMPTGIAGLDKILGGGLVKGSISVLAGDYGTGKTTLALQFLYYGAKYYNENGVLISIEQKPGHILQAISEFIWADEFESLLKDDQIHLYYIDPLDAVRGSSLTDMILSLRPTRFVLDSLTFFSQMFEYYQSMFEKLMPTLSLQDRKFLEKKLEPPRRKLVRWFHEMKNMGTTAILTAEKSLGVRATRLSFAEYLSDCFILLHYSHCGHERRRAIEILKLRGRPHSKWIHPLDITPKGIEIRSEQYIPRYQVK